MDIDLTDDQELLRETAAKFMKATCDLVTVRSLGDTKTGMPDGYLARAADLGWFALLVDEDHGGGSVSGEGVRDAAIVAEERGRGLQPGPFVPMNIVALALSRCGSPEQRESVLQSIVAGQCVATWAATDQAGAWSPGSSVTATPVAGGFSLAGTCGVVQDGAIAQWFLVAAGHGRGMTQFLVPASAAGLTVTSLDGLDVTQRFAAVRFDSVIVAESSVVGIVGGAAIDVEHQLQAAVVLATAEAIGAMDTLFEMTRVYAGDRIAFGRPIGSFQAVKHQLADMSLSVEASKGIAVAATRAVQAGQPDAGEIASMAKAYIGDAGIDVSQGCFQVFGGIGFTWEHDLHLYLRRLSMGSLLFGSPDWHRERICTLHGI
jgi:alkylation response protein AidB-like acyl-CoA dehydrogenase